MADPFVDYEWDFESPLREEDFWADEGDAGGDDQEPTPPWGEEDEDEDAARREEEDEEPPRKRVRLVQFAAGPLDTLDG
jgi:hypothetical protein